MKDLLKVSRIHFHYNSMRYICQSLVLLIIMFTIFSCTNDDNSTIEPSEQVCFTTFSFLAKDNACLSEDIRIQVSEKDSIIECFIPHLEVKTLVATFSGTYQKVEVGGIIQESGKTLNDFNNKVRYLLTSKDGKQRTYTILLYGNNGIPCIDIQTENSVAITSKEEYVKAHITIHNSPNNPAIDSICQIRGRGHGTWNSHKKPYKIKFNKKTSVFGFPPAKDWVLLSIGADKSLIRTSFMCEVSKAVGVEYTVNYQHVDLYLNGQYQGTYLLTDQVETGKNRVQCSNNGFFIERDNYWYTEPLNFVTYAFNCHYTFKYPKPEKGEISEGDDNYNYISNYVIKLEYALKEIEKGDTLSYREYIDVNSFARWYLAQQILANYDPNYFYVMPTRGEKLKMLPLWDADWSLGNGVLDIGAWRTPPMQADIDAVLFLSYDYFKYIAMDPYFNRVVYDLWKQFKEHIHEINEHMRSIAETLKYTQMDNFRIYNVLGNYQAPGLTAFNTWEEEVEYVFYYFNERMKWLDTYLKYSI